MVCNMLPAIYEPMLTGGAFTICCPTISASMVPYPPHWHEAFEIGYVRSGHGQFMVDDREYQYSPGQVYLVNDVERHMAYTDEKASSFFVVHFDPHLLYSTGQSNLDFDTIELFQCLGADFDNLLPIDNPITGKIIGLLEVIEHEHSQRDAGWQVIIKGKLLEIIGLLIRHFRTGQYSASLHRRRTMLARIRPALDLIEADPAQVISLNALAKATCLSNSHFGALFREVMGVSPLAYRDRLRIGMAKRCLRESGHSVTEIALQCGFSTKQQFGRVFLRSVGLSARAYRYAEKEQRFVK